MRKTLIFLGALCLFWFAALVVGHGFFNARPPSLQSPSSYTLVSLGALPDVDQELVAYEGSNSEVLVKSVHEAIPTLGGTSALEEVSYPAHSNVLFFAAFRPGIDDGVSDLYSFNIASSTFRTLTNAYGYFGGSIELSPDGTRFLSILSNASSTDEQSLYLVDMNTDSVSILKTLPLDQTFVASRQGDGYPVGQFSWVDDHTVSYTIYRQTDMSNASSTNPVERTVTMTLPD